MKKIYFLLLAFCFFNASKAQIINLPDVNLKMKLVSMGVDTNSNFQIEISEALNLKFLDISNSNIASLLGLENFANLEYLNCSNNPIFNTIDFNILKKLTYLNCSYITSIAYFQIVNSNLSTLVLEGLPNLQYLDCTGNKLLTSLNVSGATNLTEMWASNNKLSSINIDGLTSLKKLYCQGNQFTTLAVNNLTTLEILSCGSNLLTSLNVSSLGNMKSLSCDYNKLQRLDVTNLSKLTTLNCSYNALWELKVNGLVNLKELNCQENVIPSLNIVGLNSLETLWCNVNGLSMLDVKGLNKLIDLRCNYNKLASLDLTGLTTISTLECFHNQLKTLDISDLVNVKSLRCDQNQLTSLFIRNGSNEGNNLNFSQNPDLLYICADESQLEQVKSLATNYGYSNCNVNSYCSFKPVGSYYAIKGINNFDGNNDGCDALDSSLPNLKFNLSDGTNTGSVIADINGNYSIYLAAGTHSITPVIENPAYFSISPTTLNVNFPTQTSPLTQDFCITPIGTHKDLEITLIPLEVARPGFNTKYKLIYKNKGNTTQSGAVSLTYSDSVLDLVTANPVVSTQAMNNLSWNFTNLKPFESKEITFTIKVNAPTATPAVNNGDVLVYTADINSTATDETPLDNTFALNQTVVGSYDPNDKTCLEGSSITPNLIGEYVHYLIRFENNGTYAAQNIVVKDMIDLSKFDISTLIPTSSSHSFVTNISNANKVEFIFENINLPFDDATNDGYIAFKIKTLPTLKVGDTFTNDASIYFDYNFPVVTKPASSAFKTLATKDFEFSNYFTLYPNPAKEVLNITAKETIEIQSISIYNTLVQLVLVIPNAEKVSKIDVSSLTSGNYFVKINSDKGSSNVKFIKD